MTNRVLLVDDEENIIDAIKKYLEQEDGIEIFTATDGKTALEISRKEKPDLIILDIMLPEIDGLNVCRTLRHESSVYIIMLTAKTDDMDKMAGYAVGADSYVTKPFSPRILVAKINAALKRINRYRKYEVDEDTIEINGMKINNRKKMVRIDGRVIDLTGKEFDLLWFLASHQNHVFNRYELMEEIWGDDFYGSSDTVTVHVRRLREKIEENPSKPKFIKTVWGVGYKFEFEEDDTLD